MTCVWLKAERRATSLPLPKVWREGIDHLRPPVNNTLQGTSSWVNLVTGRDRRTPPGWSGRTSGLAAADFIDQPRPSLGEADDASGA